MALRSSTLKELIVCCMVFIITLNCAAIKEDVAEVKAEVSSVDAKVERTKAEVMAEVESLRVDVAALAATAAKVLECVQQPISNRRQSAKAKGEVHL